LSYRCFTPTPTFNPTYSNQNQAAKPGDRQFWRDEHARETQAAVMINKQEKKFLPLIAFWLFV